MNKCKCEKNIRHFLTKEITRAIGNIALKYGYYYQIVKSGRNMITAEIENKQRNFIFEVQKTRTQGWVCLEEDCLGGKLSHMEPMLYNHLFSEELGTGKDKLEPEEAPTVELKDTSRIVYPNSAPEVKYKK